MSIHVYTHTYIFMHIFLHKYTLAFLPPFGYPQWRITIRRNEITITAIYHPPFSPANNVTNNAFLDELIEWVMQPVAEKKNVIIICDFNINNPNDTDANILIDTPEVLGF